MSPSLPTHVRWQAFVNVGQETLFNLISAANFLDIPALLDLTCAKVREHECTRECGCAGPGYCLWLRLCAWSCARLEGLGMLRLFVLWTSVGVRSPKRTHARTHTRARMHSPLPARVLQVATMLKGKTPEQVKESFNIEGEFTPEEEAKVNAENPWLEEL